MNYGLPGYLLPTLKRSLQAHTTYADWDRASDRDVAAIPGACTLMRREDILLDDDLLLYFPEETLARRHQKPMRFLAAARVKHHEKSSTRSWFATRIFFRDLLVYCRKHHGGGRMLLLLAAEPAGVLADVVVEQVHNEAEIQFKAIPGDVRYEDVVE